MASSVPTTLNRPGWTEVAPRNAAASAVRVKLFPTPGLPLPEWASSTTPARPANDPETMKLRRTRLGMRMPTSCAASALVPRACRYRPKGVCPSRYQTAIATNASRNTSRGMPNQVPVPKSVNEVGMPWTTEAPWVIALSTPTTTDAEPSVVIRALTPKLVTTIPLTTPTKAPIAIPITTPTRTGRCQSAYIMAVSTEVSPATEPTDRSNWPHTSGTIEPSAMIASTDWLAMMLRQL